MGLMTRFLVLAGVGLIVWVAARALRSYFEGAKVPSRFDPTDAGVQLSLYL